MTRRSRGSDVGRVVLVCGLALAALLAGGRTAHAALFELRASGFGGAITGWGADAATADFFDETRGPGLGAEIGGRILVLDVSISFLQVMNGSSRAGTLSQALAGIAFDIPISDDDDRPPPSAPAMTSEPGSPPPPAPARPQRSSSGGRTVLRPGLHAGFAFGTPGPVDPPLTNDQISDKGLVAQASVAIERQFNRVIGLGLQGVAGYHYFLGGQATVNTAEAHSQGIHLGAFVALTFHLPIF